MLDTTFGPVHEVAIGSLNAAGGIGMVEIVSGSPVGGPRTDQVLASLSHPDGGLLPGERFGRALGAGFTIPEGTVLDLDDGWGCGVGTKTFVDVPAEPIIAALAPLAGHPGETIPGEVIDVTLSVVSSTDLDITIDIAKLDFARLNLSPTSCRVANTSTTPHPFETTRGEDLCEP